MNTEEQFENAAGMNDRLRRTLRQLGDLQVEDQRLQDEHYALKTGTGLINGDRVKMKGRITEHRKRF